MNRTAILHIAATVAVGAGIVASSQPMTAGLLAVGGILFVAGIVLARRKDSTVGKPDRLG